MDLLQVENSQIMLFYFINLLFYTFTFTHRLFDDTTKMNYNIRTC